MNWFQVVQSFSFPMTEVVVSETNNITHGFIRGYKRNINNLQTVLTV